MKIKKSYLKKKYNLQSTDVHFYFSNHFCLKAHKTREFQRICLKNHSKPVFLPSSFNLSSSREAQGPATFCVFTKSLGFSEISFSENLKEISSVSIERGARKMFYEIKQEKLESTKMYAQNFLYLLNQQTKTV